jgi:hypothetical protein
MDETAYDPAPSPLGPQGSPHFGAPGPQANQPTLAAQQGFPLAPAPGHAPSYGMVPAMSAQGGPLMAPMPPPVPGVHGPKGTVRNGVKCLLLGIVTFGVYQIIWFISTCNEMKAFLQRDEPSWLKIVGLSIVTCNIYGLYWQITKCGALVHECQLRAGVQSPQNHGWLYLVPYYNVVLMTDELNKAWQGPA